MDVKSQFQEARNALLNRRAELLSEVAEIDAMVGVPAKQRKPSKSQAHYSVEQRQTAVARYMNGERGTDIAASIGVAVPTFYGWLKDFGVPTRGKAAKVA